MGQQGLIGIFTMRDPLVVAMRYGVVAPTWVDESMRYGVHTVHMGQAWAQQEHDVCSVTNVGIQ